MAKRLARVAGYLDAQLYDLRDHPVIDPVQLSRHTDRLLVLHQEDREAVLFALRCLRDEAGLVRHGLSVAVHLLDLAIQRRMPRQACKAVAACAMVHDMGKILLPEVLLKAPRLDAQQHEELKTHVAKLEPCLESCRWLSGSIRRSIVNEINERLDGSGYPNGLSGSQLGELSRLAMVVDVVDVMRRDRPDRPAWRMSDIYRHLLDQSMRYDQGWVRHYLKVFGLLPIGALVRFETGEQAWVQRLDTNGRPSQVQLTTEAIPPQRLDGEILRGAEIDRLGKPVAEIPVAL
jgi:HD-GYP domain-containing protein (c-di-GMP phosphodiesterase class II)